MKRLLLIWHSQSGHTEAMMRAVAEGAAELAGEVELRGLRAFDAGLDDLLWANGLLIGTPENFGYLSGAIKDFLDRTYYPAQGKTTGLRNTMETGVKEGMCLMDNVVFQLYREGRIAAGTALANINNRVLKAKIT